MDFELWNLCWAIILRALCGFAREGLSLLALLEQAATGRIMGSSQAHGETDEEPYLSIRG